MSLRKYSAWLALAFGPLVALESVLRNGGAWSGWTIADGLAALLLIGAGVTALRGSSDLAGRWLTGAWGFAAAILLLSLLSLAPDLRIEPMQHEGPWFLVAAGWLLITAVIGFAVSLPGGNQNARR